MTRPASAVSFRVLLVAIAAVVLLLDMTLARTLTTRRGVGKAAADCSAAPVAVAQGSESNPNPSGSPVPAAPRVTSAAPDIPPGVAAAFGSCADAVSVSKGR